MNYCCRSMTSCCSGICKVLEDSCKECCDCLKSIFRTPFDIVALVTILVCGYPIIITIISLPSINTPCFQQFNTLLLVETLGNLIHLIFAIYMACVFRQSYNNIEDKMTGEQIQESNILDRVKNLFLYDIGVFFYIFIYIFYIYWTIKCSTTIDQIQNHPITYKSTNNRLITCDSNTVLTPLITNTSSNYAFIGYFLLAFIILVFYQACKEGSCTISSVCANCCLCITCGLCDYRDKKKFQQQQDDYGSTGKQHQQTYNSNQSYKQQSNRPFY